jgi:uncharacterized membrane protein (UPF0127 family)
MRTLSTAALVLLALVLVCCSRCKPHPCKPSRTAVAVRVIPGGPMGASKILRLGLRATYAERAASIGRLPAEGLLYAYPRDRALGVDLATSAEPVDVVLLDARQRVLRVAVSVPPTSRQRQWVSVAPRLHRYAILLPGEGARKVGLVQGVQVSFTLPEPAQPHRVLIPVDLHPRGRRSVRVLAEVALTEPERTMGLMWRKGLGPREGMLFRFERSYHITFWMKNTLISLDMIFVNDNHVVTGVVHRAKPKQEARSWVGRVNSRYVLEVPAGFARRHGITRGTGVGFTLP